MSFVKKILAELMVRDAGVSDMSVLRQLLKEFGRMPYKRAEKPRPTLAMIAKRLVFTK